MRRFATRFPDSTVSIVILIVGAITRSAWILIDHGTRVANDSTLFLISARSWIDPATSLPLYRERPSIFTVVWAPFLDLPHAGDWIAVIQGALTVAATVLVFLGLRRFGVPRRWAGLAGVVMVILPTPVYYEHTLLSESLAYTATLVWVFLLAWAVRPVRAWRVGVLAAYTLLLAGTVRNSFLLMFIACVAATAAIVLFGVLRRRSFVKQRMRVIAVVGLFAVAGAGVGLLGSSSLQGVISGRPPLEQVRNTIALSGFNGAFKFGNLVDCSELTAESAHARQSICANQALAAGREATFDDYMGAGPVYADWSQTSAEMLAVYGQEYRDVVREAVLAHPLQALRIVIRDGSGILAPLVHERYTTAAYPVALLPQVAPQVSVPQEFGPPESDILYRAADFQDVPRILTLLLILGLLAMSWRRRSVLIPAWLTLLWLAYWLGFAITGVPTVRFLVPMDPVLIVALVLALATIRSSPAVHDAVASVGTATAR